MTGKEMIAHAEKLGMLVRESHPFGDVLGHDPVNAVLMTWYRNNTIHAFALPSLIACLLVNRRRRIHRDQLLQMLAAVYPYLQSELYIVTPSNPAGSRASLENETTQWLDHLQAQGLVRIEDGEVGAPPLESDESYRLALLSQIAMQMLERFFIVVGLLQQAGQHAIDRRTLERHCTTLAQRISRLYGLNAPEFFDARLFHNFVDTLIARDVLHVAEDGTLELRTCDRRGDANVRRRPADGLSPRGLARATTARKQRRRKQRHSNRVDGRRRAAIDVEAHAAADDLPVR